MAVCVNPASCAFQSPFPPIRRTIVQDVPENHPLARQNLLVIRLNREGTGVNASPLIVAKQQPPADEKFEIAACVCDCEIEMSIGPAKECQTVARADGHPAQPEGAVWTGQIDTPASGHGDSHLECGGRAAGEGRALARIQQDKPIVRGAGRRVLGGHIDPAIARNQKAPEIHVARF